MVGEKIARKQVQTKKLNLHTKSMMPLHLLRRLTKNRALTSNRGLGWRLKVSHREEKGVEDLRISLKLHNMATKRTTCNDGCTYYEKKANIEKNRNN